MSRRRSLVQDNKARINELWRAGVSLRKIAAAIGYRGSEQGISGAISDWRKEEGKGKWPNRARAAMKPEQREELRRAWLAGEDAAALAERAGLSRRDMQIRIAGWRNRYGEADWPKEPGRAGQVQLAEVADQMPEMETPRSIVAVRAARRIRLAKDVSGLNNHVSYVVTVQMIAAHSATQAPSARERCDSAEQAAKVFAMFWRAARSLGSAQDRAAGQRADA